MAHRDTHKHKKPSKTGSRAPSRDDLTSTYTELNIRKVGRVTNTQTDGLDPTYSQLNFRQNEISIAEEEDLTLASGPGEMQATSQADAQEQDSKVKTRIRTYRLICLLCIVTSGIILTVAGLSIHVSQIRQCNVTSERNCDELNSTIQSKLSVLNSDLSVLNRMHSDLRHQFTEMETKYRSVNETKAQICELLTSRREPTCSQGWIKNEGRCYFISSILTSYAEAREHCSEIDSRLLEINSEEKMKIISNAVDRYGTWWIGKCAEGNVASYLLYKYYERRPCSFCDRSSGAYSCRSKYRFICEKSARSYPEIPEEIAGLCQQHVGPTSIK